MLIAYGSFDSQAVAKDCDEVVRQLLSKNFKIAPEKISPDTRFMQDLKFDDLDEVETIMSLEQEFKIEMAEDALRKLKTVRNLSAFLKTKAPDCK